MTRYLCPMLRTCMIMLLLSGPIWTMAQPVMEGFSVYSVDRKTRVSVRTKQDKTFVIDKAGDTTCVIPVALKGSVAVSKDGRTIAEWVAEGDTARLRRPRLTFYRQCKEALITYTDPSIANEMARWGGKGFIRNDSLYHQMAKNPFFLDGEKLFMGMADGTMAVFDMKSLQVVYAGSGANHFKQNYFSIPARPYSEPKP